MPCGVFFKGILRCARVVEVSCLDRNTCSSTSVTFEAPSSTAFPPSQPQTPPFHCEMATQRASMSAIQACMAHQLAMITFVRRHTQSIIPRICDAAEDARNFPAQPQLGLAGVRSVLLQHAHVVSLNRLSQHHQRFHIN
jgi:hypothetical protein